MRIYEMNVSFYARVNIQVQAENYKEAQQKAFDEVSEMSNQEFAENLETDYIETTGNRVVLTKEGIPVNEGCFVYYGKRRYIIKELSETNETVTIQRNDDEREFIPDVPAKELTVYEPKI